MMSPSIKRQWVEALRSNKYIQGFGGLRIDKAYCPLGLLCKLHQHDCHISQRHWRPIYSSFKDSTSYSYMYRTTLHENVASWAYLSSYNPTLRLKNGRVRTIGYINDALKLTFQQIADLIEEQL